MVVFFPTAPRHATSVFLTFRVSHCIKLPGSPDGSPPQLLMGFTTCKCYWLWNFLLLWVKYPSKIGILIVSKMKFGEIWDFLCYECHVILAKGTRFRPKSYVIVYIYIYIYFRWRTYWIRAPPTQDARQCCSYTFLGSGSLWFLRLFLGGAYIQYMIYYSSDKAYLTLRIILPHPPHHHQLFHHRPPTYASYSPNVLPN